MAITYDAPSNTITVTGYTESTPCTFEDVYQADVAGGWGVVSKQGTAQYLFDCRLVIGDGSTTTWLIDFGKHVQFSAGSASGTQRLFDVKANATLRFGVLVDAALKTSRDGVDVTSNAAGSVRMILPTSGTVQFYSCKFFCSTGQSAVFLRNNHRAWNCYFERVVLQLTGAGAIDGFNIVISRARMGGVTGDRFCLFNDTYALVLSTYYSFTVKNALVRQYIRIADGNPSQDHYFINVDSNTWTFNFTGTNTGKVYRQYEFDLSVTDKDNNPISGATVTLKDKNDDTVFSVTTDANGKIATQTVTRGWYEQATGNTLNDLSPHKLIIEKAGYQTYVKKFIFEEKVKWEIKLAKAVGIFLDFGKPVINLKKSDPENRNVMVL